MVEGSRVWGGGSRGAENVKDGGRKKYTASQDFWLKSTPLETGHLRIEDAQGSFNLLHLLPVSFKVDCYKLFWLAMQ